MTGSVGQPVLWVTISQPASWLLLHPASQSFSQAASQPISEEANKSDLWPAGPSVNPLITSRPSVSQEPSSQSPSRWASRPVSHPVGRPVTYEKIKPYKDLKEKHKVNAHWHKLLLRAKEHLIGHSREYFGTSQHNYRCFNQTEGGETAGMSLQMIERETWIKV